jgi:general secretion pathway protein H
MANGNRHQGGFSLFEMMIVLAILAMAMTLAPSIIAGLDGSRLRAASDDLMARLRETRNQALRRGSMAELVLDTSKLLYATPVQPGFHRLPGIVDKVQITPAALLQPGGIAHIRFSGDGTATEARIVLGHGGSSTAILVDWLTGRVHQDG